jgi:hypothetical protein
MQRVLEFAIGFCIHCCNTFCIVISSVFDDKHAFEANDDEITIDML